MTAIGYFRIVGKVIEKNLEAIINSRGIDRKTAIKEIILYCEHLTTEYFKHDVPDIHYNDPLCRIAYLYVNVPVHSAAIEYVLENSPHLERFLQHKQKENRRVNICVLGGGPGTELLSLTKRIERAFPSQMVLKFLLFDKFGEWIDSWHAIEQEMEANLRKKYGNEDFWPARWSGNYFPVDVSDTSRFGNLGNCFGQDINIFSYFISEIYKLEGFNEFFKEMVKNAPKKAKFLFIERSEKEKEWRAEIENLARDSGLMITDGISKEDGVMPPDEQKTELGNIYFELERLGRQPRLTWKIFSIEATKQSLADII